MIPCLKACTRKTKRKKKNKKGRGVKKTPRGTKAVPLIYINCGGLNQTSRGW